LGTGVSVRIGYLAPILSLAIQRFLYSHMYTTMGLLGLFIAARGMHGLNINHVLPIVSITITTTGLYVLNDVFDIEIDRISHPERALPQGRVSVPQALITAILLLAIGPVIAIWVSLTSGLLVGMIALCGIAYSVPPIRLRRFPVVPNGVIGFMVVLSFLAGASFWGRITGKLAFGGLLLWALFLFHSPEKDLDQEEGDAVGGVKTLPVILGRQRAIKITSAMGLSAFVFPILFVLLFDLHLILVAAMVLLFLAEAYELRRFSLAPDPAAGRVWYLGLFGVFVVLQVLLLIGALL